jgi:hypothetical protein
MKVSQSSIFALTVQVARALWQRDLNKDKQNEPRFNRLVRENRWVPVEHSSENKVHYSDSVLSLPRGEGRSGARAQVDGSTEDKILLVVTTCSFLIHTLAR